MVPPISKPKGLHSARDMSPMYLAMVGPSPWRNWYKADWTFGQGTVIFFCASIGLFALLNVIHRLRHSRFAASVGRFPGYGMITSFLRSLAGRQYRLGSYSTVTTGTLALVGVMIAFFSAMAFGPKPYYWPSMSYGHSPPLATRSGWMSIAILPFSVILASKWNYISLLTGVSHEKLQVLHQWSAYIMFALALLHTFPFLVVYGQNHILMEEWRTSVFIWTGVAALVPMGWLTFMSIAPLRNRFYETFKSLHYVVSILFTVFTFLHCDFELTSADYFLGFAAFYLLALTIRWSIAFFHNGVAHRAHISLLEDDILHITIPTHLTWASGQHYFFRFLGVGGLHGLTSHPFTVASIPSTGKTNDATGLNEIELYLKVMRGITKRLAAKAADPGIERTGISVLIDGPYGGVGQDFRYYDNVLLMAGGSGGTFILGILRDLVEIESQCKSITVVYATRSSSFASTFRDAFLDAILSAKSKGIEITVRLHVTGHASFANNDLDEDASEKQTALVTSRGRPSLADIIREQAASSAAVAGSVGVVACGPADFTCDVRSAVAEVQMEIALGRTEISECYLHTEVFGW